MNPSNAVTKAVSVQVSLVTDCCVMFREGRLGLAFQAVLWAAPQWPAAKPGQLDVLGGGGAEHGPGIEGLVVDQQPASIG